ncbi:MAG TPA: thioredoxin domain-containing protein [Thermoflexia bacterium]|nr:thioredoxin domain-containing protein [Thermoflexia bacterium]
MNKTKWVLISILIVFSLLLAACDAPGTPEPTATTIPEPTAKSAATEDTQSPEETSVASEPTGPVEIMAPAEPGVCENQPMPQLPVRPVDENDWLKGASGDDVELTIIEYSDFECPGCSGTAPMLAQFLADHPTAQLTYRHFTLSFHEKAILTAEASEAAGAQGKFWEMHDLIFANRAEWQPLSEEEARAKMSAYAEELDLDLKQFDSALDDGIYLAAIEAETEESQELGLPGTPSLILNGYLYPTDQLGLSLQGLEAFLDILSLADKQYAAAPEITLDVEKNYVATVNTTQGAITFDLFTESAPTNINNFIFLANEGWYEDTDYFFVQDNFVALTGDPTNSGMGYPGYYCTGETQGIFDRSGLVGMLPNGQFFITKGPEAASLNSKFALIGQVTAGLDVLDKLASTQPGAAAGVELDQVKSVTIVEE